MNRLSHITASKWVRRWARHLTPRFLAATFACGFLVLVAADPTAAQRPIRMFDPLYRGETAQRSFFDTYAVTAELSYRPPGFLTGNDLSSNPVSGVGGDALGLNLRFDYRLSSRFDLGAFVDASGNGTGRSLRLSWVMLKYFKRLDGTDYSVRLAVDPSSDGRSGFPQADLAFLYTSLLSPTLSTHFGMGMRRVQIGIQELVQAEAEMVDPGDPVVTSPAPATEILRSRALGWEVHMTTSYNILFDPAGSNMFVAVLGQGGSYDLVEWTADNPGTEEDETSERTTTAFRGGVIWVRSGLEIHRPGYQFIPYLAFPATHWQPDSGDWPTPRARVGLRLMLR